MPYSACLSEVCGVVQCSGDAPEFRTQPAGFSRPSRDRLGRSAHAIQLGLRMLRQSAREVMLSDDTSGQEACKSFMFADLLSASGVCESF